MHPRSGPGVTECFWCNRPFITVVNGVKIRTRGIRTVEHLVPLAMGGSGQYQNKTAACFPCNNSRGMIFLWEKHCKELRDRFHGMGKKTASSKVYAFVWSWEKASRNLKKRTAFLAYWKELEKTRMGFSPHLAVEFVIPSRDDVLLKLRRHKHHALAAHVSGVGLVPFHVAMAGREEEFSPPLSDPAAHSG